MNETGASRTFEPKPVQLLVEHIAIKKADCAEGDGLSRRGYAQVDGEVCEELADFRHRHGQWMTLLMEDNETFDPVNVGLFRLEAEVPYASDNTNLIQ